LIWISLDLNIEETVESKGRFENAYKAKQKRVFQTEEL
jgi:hypothetical protein